jgi:hypothetical protein
MEHVEQDSCCICLENLPKNSRKLTFTPCCGKGTHVECGNNFFSSNLINDQKVNVHIVKQNSQHHQRKNSNKHLFGLRKVKHWHKEVLVICTLL